MFAVSAVCMAFADTGLHAYRQQPELQQSNLILQEASTPII